jgi:ATP-dependent helicase Lhr and Lhr-like helicase
MRAERSSRVSGSEEAAAIALLDERVRRWIWHQNWKELRDIQREAIPLVLNGEQDLVITAATASGKTEAAIVPLASRLLETETGLGVLMVSPLRALINDQFGRLELMGGELGLSVARWHGDVAANKKQEVLLDAPRILIITPESLEALFVRRAGSLDQLFGDLEAIVVDELHAFIGSERGRQLQSLLARIELVVGRRIRRIALSATLGDMGMAAEFLRPGEGQAASIVRGGQWEQELQLQVRGYRLPLPEPPAESGDERPDPLTPIADHLFRKLRGGHNLIFANTRGRVEVLSDLLRAKAEAAVIPNSFWPHHGSLAKPLREDVEARLKDASAPANAVCTVTLELGIDIGTVESIAQVGAPSSVAALRQRLGRSGRRGEPAVLRIYVQEPELTADTPLQSTLRDQLVQSIAATDLLLDHWYEPPAPAALHLSTLAQQTMSLIAERGGVSPRAAWHALCAGGPFRAVDAELYAEFLRSLAEAELITQSTDGSLLLDRTGERIVNHFEFYAAFTVAEEFRLVSGGRSLGTLPIDNPLGEGMLLVFAGRRWRVRAVDYQRKVIEVEAAIGGRPPRFGGGGPSVHDRIRAVMRERYESEDIPGYLDSNAIALLEEGRAAFHELGLGETRLIEVGPDVVLFPWAGDRVMHTIVIALRSVLLDASVDGLAVVIEEADAEDVESALADLSAGRLGTAEDLAAGVLNKVSAKYDWALSESLLIRDYAGRALDLGGASVAAQGIADAGAVRHLSERPRMASPGSAGAGVASARSRSSTRMARCPRRDSKYPGG